MICLKRKTTKNKGIKFLLIIYMTISVILMPVTFLPLHVSALTPVFNDFDTLEDDLKELFQNNIESMSVEPFSFSVTGDALKFIFKTDNTGELIPEQNTETYYSDWFMEQLNDMRTDNFNAYNRMALEIKPLTIDFPEYISIETPIENTVITFPYTINWMDNGVGLLTPSQGREAVRAHAQEFLDSPEYPQTGTDDDKLRAINEYICSTFQYDYRLFVEGEENDVIYTAFQMINDVGQGAIGDYPRGVCQAYAMYGYIMLKEAGYEALTINGTAMDSNDEIVNHAWNMVRVGSNWYHIDFTWNDPTTSNNPEPYVTRQSGEGTVKDEYLLLSDTKISEDHSWDLVNEFGFAYPLASKAWNPNDPTMAITEPAMSPTNTPTVPPTQTPEPTTASIVSQKSQSQAISKEITDIESFLSQEDISGDVQPTAEEEKTVLISGQLTNDQGEPISGAFLRLYATDQIVQTDENGKYEFKNVKIGSYRLYLENSSGEVLAELPIVISFGDKTAQSAGIVQIRGANVEMNLSYKDDSLYIKDVSSPLFSADAGIIVIITAAVMILIAILIIIYLKKTTRAEDE